MNNARVHFSELVREPKFV